MIPLKMFYSVGQLMFVVLMELTGAGSINKDNALMMTNYTGREYSFCTGDFIMVSAGTEGVMIGDLWFDNIEHESIHMKQYQQLGPIGYLRLVVVPSMITNTIYTVLMRKDMVEYEDVYEDYLSMPWETMFIKE